MSLRVCVAGATGWTGSEVAKAVAAQSDMTLAAAVARGADGSTLHGVRVVGTVAEALAQPLDVFVDYTKPDAVKAHVLAALRAGVHVVVGTSGLGADDYAEIERVAEARGLGVIAAGNFSLTASLLQRFALMAVEHVPDVEVIDYAKETKPDVPSGTARELAERLGATRAGAASALPLAALKGPPAARGAALAGVPVHSVRLPGHVLACEAIFGLPGERLSLRHEAGSSAVPYVGGTLLAIRRAPRLRGLVRGLDTILFGP